MIRRVKVQEYKSLKDVEVVFPGSGVAVIIGPNAAGKSNLFDEPIPEFVRGRT